MCRSVGRLLAANSHRHSCFSSSLGRTMDRIKKRKSLPTKPISLALMEEVRPAALRGQYDPETDTWSNRDYEAIAAKKHNEAM